MFRGYGTALKPAYEPIIVAMKPCDGTYAENAINHGVAGLNIDECRVEGGRWPANLIHDGSDNVIELFPDTGKSSGGRIGNAGGNAVQCVPTGKFKKGQSGFGDSGSAARFFYCAKASKTEKNAGIEIAAAKQRDMSRNADQASMNGGDGNPFNRGAKIVRNHHPTLDPFMGSGTTLIACQRLEIDCDGIEMDEDYFEIAQSRIRFYSGRELDYELDTSHSKKEPTQLNLLDYLESV
jgi:site-specific DNA-methyltransferase (adenine-specific)